jgi:predicted O-methyltransferase YrrM
MTLPNIPQALLSVRPIDWSGLPRRFMNPGELEVLVALFRPIRPRHVIEFGVNVGRTAKALIANVPGIETYTGIDVPVGYVPAKAVQRGEVPARPGELVNGDPRFRLVIRPRGSLDLTADDLAPCDAVFIDGDHSRDGVAHDTALAFALTRPGGMIVWHDYHDRGTVDVKPFLDERRARGRTIARVQGTWLAFERVPPS